MNLLIYFISWVVVAIAAVKACEATLTSPPCDYTAIYAFGDSNTDTGGIYAAFYPPELPYGETFFHRPAGRASDGRLIIDFISEKLKLPYLSPYLDSIASDFRTGANFATGGATIQRPITSWFVSGLSPFNLEIQVEHFVQLTDRSAYFHNQERDDEILKRLPKPEDLAKAIFVVDIGQNDISVGLQNLSQPSAIAGLVAQFIEQVRILYGKGGRNFWIHNTGPIGCLPQSAVKEPDPAKVDRYGCMKLGNDVASEFNTQLKSGILKLRRDMPDAALVYVDMYAAKYGLISDAKNQGNTISLLLSKLNLKKKVGHAGFEEGMRICCGYHGIGYDVWCGKRGKLNGSDVFADSCASPEKYISWDGVHYTEAANRWIANRLASGSLSDPPLDITTACNAKEQ